MKAIQVLLAALLALFTAAASAQLVWKCDHPDGTSEYANGAAVPKGCKKVDIEAATVVTIPAPKLPATKPASAANFPKIDSATQRSRDNDRRKVLESELQTQTDKLTALRKDFNNGEPERHGDERNYQKYLDRVEQMRDEISRTESNIASVKRELTQLRD